MNRTNNVVVLDLDGTIIPDESAFRAAASTVLDAHLTGQVPVDPGRDLVGELLIRARQRWRTSPLRMTPEALGVSSWEAMWSDLEHTNPGTAPVATGHAIAVWRDTLTALGADPGRARSAAQMLITQREALTRPYPGARETLEYLADRNRIWLVTHGSSGLQRRKLRLAGLEQYLDLVLISAEVGHLKDTVEFAAMIQKLVSQGDLTIRAVIGDSDSDLTLAERGDWPAIHICPRWPCENNDPSVQHRKSLTDAESDGLLEGGTRYHHFPGEPWITDP